MKFARRPMFIELFGEVLFQMSRAILHPMY